MAQATGGNGNGEPRREARQGEKAKARKTLAAPGARSEAGGGAVPRSTRRSRRPARAEAPATLLPAAVLDAVVLTEEEQIESAKYLPRELPPRLFEEERFVFPESYGINRVRLLVKDPEWIFAHWDVDPRSMESFRADLGERGMALSRLTLKVADVDNGGSSVILLPYGARSWYVRTDSARRSYKAQLGLTLPSGEFRLLAESNTVTTPRVGPSPVKAVRRMSYPQAAAVTREQAVAAARDEGRSAAAEAGPWNPPAGQVRVDGSAGPSSATSAGAKSGAEPEKGGASDVYRR